MQAETNRPACPSLENGESPEDCPWASVARTILTNPATPPATQLKALAPAILHAAAENGKIPVIRNSWGKSINYDEIAKDVIVYPPLLETLAGAFGVPVENHDDRAVTHAGLEHTFGYLFSVLKTPFGYKRARWVKGEIEAGLGLPAGALGPTPSRGDLLKNVTWTLGRIAFRHEPEQFASLMALRKSVVPGLAAYDFSKLRITRLEERLDSAPVIIRTDFVEFPNPQSDTHLLVYSIYYAKTGHAEIVSGFPVQKNFMAGVMTSDTLGAGKPVATRYNAYVDGITGKPQIGTRVVTEGAPAATEAK